MTALAEAYFHLRRIDLTEYRLKELGDLASLLAADIAKDYFPPYSIIEVRLAEGSLKGWIAVGGLMVGVHGFVADYKGFKESISEITSDAKYFGDKIINSFLDEGRLREAQIFRTERRTKVPGRIKRLIVRRDRLEENRAYLSKNIIIQEQIEIQRLLQQILEDIEPAERDIVKKLLSQDSPAEPLSEAPRVAITPIRPEQLQIFGAIEAADEAPLPDYLRRFRLSDGPGLVPATGLDPTPPPPLPPPPSPP